MFSGRASSDVLAGLRFDLPQADRSRCRCLHLRVQRADPEEASGLAVAWERIVANLSLHHLIESIAGAVAAAQDKIQRFQISAVRQYFDDDNRPVSVDVRLPSLAHDAEEGDERLVRVPLLSLVGARDRKST